MEVLCQHNDRLFYALRLPIFFMEDHMILGKVSLTLHHFENLNQPANPRNYVPTNVPIFHESTKIGPHENK